MTDRHRYRAHIKSLGWTLPVERINYDCETVEIDLTAGNGDIAEYGFDEIDLMQCTGLRADKSYRGGRPEDKLIWEGDVTEISMPDGEKRRFSVCVKTVKRNVVSHPDFDEKTAKVAITGVIFAWRGYDLFPCVDGDGVVDTSKMAIIGTIYGKEAQP